ncbi:pyridoxal phosphate-dependent aminotransferase [Rhodococcus sp. BGS-1C]|jgi:N-succinyldiaminopimelate aminotransferase|uniref:pyridoxal phosphate-dependent aminotransferase n=1 Tax=Nocardiaceae TaxID=85025 RepID=UPI0019D19FB4|nr:MULTISPECIES: pyridoxal phosphate-dependent aminotransferase [Rhodococcus]MCZ4276466.1 pyridoxal phosphate-dependent aminotransferase [Rhodococcus yunnanensis]
MSAELPNRTVERLRPFGSTVFAEMTALAVATGAVNLGQGFPDTDGPASMLAAAQDAIAAGLNQYAPGAGMPVLRDAIAADRARRSNIQYDPATEILVTVGATEGIAAAILGLVEAGDEVLLIEPYYDSYAAAIALAGARRRTVPLVADGSGYAVDLDALERAIGPDTTLLIVNSPHNPTGTVFTRAELTRIAEIACKHNLLVLTDEVYERLIFDGPSSGHSAGSTPEHVPLATLPGMFERTVTVSSAAKTFNATGWKTGWALGPANLIDAVRSAKQFMTFVGGTPFQPAVAHALEHEDQWVAELRRGLQRKRDRLSTSLTKAGLTVKASAGTYFVCADVAPLGETDAVAFCRSLPARIGVAAVPVTAFVDQPEPWKTLVRFAFCKKDDVLDEAAERLLEL